MCGRVMLAHAAKTFRAQLRSEFLVAIDLQDTVGERARIVGLDQQTAARLFDDLGEPPAAWLDQRHAAGHSFEDGTTFWLGVRRWTRHPVELTRRRCLFRAIEYATIMKRVAEFRLTQLGLDLVEIWFAVGCHVP